MDALDFQAELDATGYLKLPAGTFTPAAPLFLPSESLVVGDDSPRSLLDCDQSGYAFVHGMNRGTVPDACFTGDGFRTLGTHYLWGRGLAWDRGPAGGWPAVNELRLEYTGTTHEANGWFDVMLMGMTRRGVSNSVCNPSPWMLYFDGDRLVFAFRKLDGTVYRLQTAPLTPGGSLAVVLDVNFGLGSIALSVNGGPVPIDPLPPYASLDYNSLAPFCCGSANHSMSGPGFWGGWVADVTVSRLRVGANGADICQFDPWNAARLPTYAGGPSLPLVRTWAGGKGCAHLFALPLVDTLPVDGQARLEGVRVKGATNIPAVFLGRTFGFTGDRLDLRGGSVGVQVAGGNVSYPVDLTRCRFDGQSDCGLWLSRSIFTADHLFFRYAVRADAELHNCSGRIADVFVAPPGAAQQYGFLQSGGWLVLENAHADYEFVAGNGYALVHVRGDSDEGSARPTVFRGADLTTGPNPVVAVLPNFPGYQPFPAVSLTTPTTGSVWLEDRS